MKKKFTKQYFTIEEITTAFINCRRRKKFKNTSIEFTLNERTKLYNLLERINSRDYSPNPSSVFAVKYPKPREIWAADFSDRIVHHLIYNELNPYYESTFSTDSCSCMKNRGTLYASDRLNKHLRSITENFQKKAYFLQFDIANFFVSIYKPALLNILKRKVSTDSVMYFLLEKTILNNTIKNPVIKSTDFFDLIPSHKSLWNTDVNYGIPIGNLTSQFFSNLYLNELDQYIKHTIKNKHYVRYVDDGILFQKNKDILEDNLKQINTFLNNNLHCELAPHKTFIKNTGSPINFVGHITRHYRRYTRRRTINQFKNKIHKNKFNHKELIKITNSYLGFLRQTSSYDLRKEIIDEIVRSGYINVDKNYTKIFKPLVT